MSWRPDFDPDAIPILMFAIIVIVLGVTLLHELISTTCRKDEMLVAIQPGKSVCIATEFRGGPGR